MKRSKERDSDINTSKLSEKLNTDLRFLSGLPQRQGPFVILTPGQQSDINASLDEIRKLLEYYNPKNIDILLGDVLPGETKDSLINKRREVKKMLEDLVPSLPSNFQYL